MKFLTSKVVLVLVLVSPLFGYEISSKNIDTKKITETVNIFVKESNKYNTVTDDKIDKALAELIVTSKTINLNDITNKKNLSLYKLLLGLAHIQKTIWGGYIDSDIEKAILLIFTYQHNSLEKFPISKKMIKKINNFKKEYTNYSIQSNIINNDDKVDKALEELINITKIIYNQEEYNQEEFRLYLFLSGLNGIEKNIFRLYTNFHVEKVEELIIAYANKQTKFKRLYSFLDISYFLLFLLLISLIFNVFSKRELRIYDKREYNKMSR